MPHPTLLVLQALSRHPGPVAAGRLQRETGIPRTSLYRALADLRETGFVTHLEDEHRWALGMAAFELGFATSRQQTVQRIGRPVVRRLVDTLGHNGHLAVLHGTDVLYLVEERATRRPSLVSDVGVRIPAPWTASGLALLAALPREQVRALFPDAASFVPARSGEPPQDPTSLRRALQAVRAEGVAREEGSVTPGLSSVAAAVTGPTDLPVAAVAVTWDAGRTPAAEAEGVRQEVVRAADELGSLLR
ncbi:transcriptional regulator, IclR family [Kytococcus aerolatus]|uniref:Transcriptional regulator, IclR family n=1 Tax=Kytococcus aerolatus TaxID=592308 RepID=A0A212U627_9MICO|nr:IclR family transcriptional regulator [Kytococcus aerolatus]SNC73541.1 transcriptional regulator, IclR family [Kytococcus aerolatus]